MPFLVPDVFPGEDALNASPVKERFAKSGKSGKSGI